MLRRIACYALLAFCVAEKRFTEDELEAFDGVTRPEIFLAYGGDVYDVTSGAHFYGPGMAYAKFAGRACTRGVALPSLDDDDIHDGAAGLDPAAVEKWRGHYRTKYPVVGTLIADTAEQRGARLARRRAAADAAEAARLAAAEAAAEAAKERAVSLAELAAHDASNAELWLCISGYVFDVTKSRYLYGAGSPRSSFAGACVGRALARGGTPRAEDHTDNVAGLDDADLARLDERTTYFLGKFPLVGVLERRDGSDEL